MAEALPGAKEGGRVKKEEINASEGGKAG